MLNKTKSLYDELSRSERQVADVVLGNPQQVLQLAIADLAQLAGVSQPTVIRFCRSLGRSGYADFKLALAQSLATEVNYVHTDLTSRNTCGDVLREVIDHAVSSLLNMRTTVELRALEQAVQALARAKRVELFGLGASAVVAEDAQQKLMRLNIPVCAHRDVHNQTIIASVLDAGSVVIAISHTGRTRNLLNSVRQARASGATIIALSRSGSPLAALADIVLAADLKEDTSIYMPMRSRLAHLALLDVLVIALSLHLGDDISHRLSRVKDNLNQLRVRE
ncbi:MAG: DNA-binding transcriptional regulator HexR [Wenzhouxiangellaceae bacterium]